MTSLFILLLYFFLLFFSSGGCGGYFHLEVGKGELMDSVCLPATTSSIAYHIYAQAPTSPRPYRPGHGNRLLLVLGPTGQGMETGS